MIVGAAPSYAPARRAGSPLAPAPAQSAGTPPPAANEDPPQEKSVRWKGTRLFIHGREVKSLGKRLAAAGMTAGGVVAGAIVGSTLAVSVAPLVAPLLGLAAGVAVAWGKPIKVNGKPLSELLSPFKPNETDTPQARRSKKLGNYAVRGAAGVGAGLLTKALATLALGACGFAAGGLGGFVAGSYLVSKAIKPDE